MFQFASQHIHLNPFFAISRPLVLRCHWRRHRRLHAVVQRRLLDEITLHLCTALDNHPRRWMMAIDHRHHRPAWLFEQLDLIVPGSVTLNVRLDVDFTVPASTLRSHVGMAVRPFVVAHLGQTVAARVRFKLEPRFGQLAVQDREGRHEDAEEEIQENPVVKSQRVPWCTYSQPWLCRGTRPSPPRPVLSADLIRVTYT